MTMFVMMSAGFIVQFYLKSFGTAAVAAYGVALRVEQLFLLPVFGLTGALLPIAAQNYGAGKHDRVRQALFDCWKFGWMFMAVACPILFFASPLLMRTFTPDPEVISIGVSYLRVDGFILPVYMMLFAINSFLQALKRRSGPSGSVSTAGVRRRLFRLRLCDVVPCRRDGRVVRHCHRRGHRPDDFARRCRVCS